MRISGVAQLAFLEVDTSRYYFMAYARSKPSECCEPYLVMRWLYYKSGAGIFRIAKYVKRRLPVKTRYLSNYDYRHTMEVLPSIIFRRQPSLSLAARSLKSKTLKLNQGSICTRNLIL